MGFRKVTKIAVYVTDRTTFQALRLWKEVKRRRPIFHLSQRYRRFFGFYSSATSDPGQSRESGVFAGVAERAASLHFSSSFGHEIFTSMPR